MATGATFTFGPPAPPKASRYRSLRGKSVSAPRGTNLLEEEDGDVQASAATKKHRRRSKSVAATPTISTFPRVPPLPPTPLSMTTDNILAGSKSKHKPAKSFLGFGSSKSSDNVLLRRQKTLDNINTAAANANGNTGINIGGAGTRQVPAVVSHILGGGTVLPQPTTNISGAVGGANTSDHPPAGPSAAAAAPATLAAVESRAEGAKTDDGTTNDAAAQKRKNEEEKEAARLAARLEAETDRILAEQKKKDLSRLQAQLAAAEQAAAAAVHKTRSPILEKFTFLTKRKANTGSLASSTLSPTSSSTPSVDFPRSNTTSIDPRMGVEASGKLVVPLTEAPASAINSNSAERRVAVRCKQSTLDLPVEWETTTLEILFSAASCLNQMMANINPSTSLVIETFSAMGLERRLRRYEQIRDVMNSWDKDTQNTLVVIPQDSADGDKDLDISSVPRTSVAPNGFTLSLYHSQKHGKWTKRYITLMETGQMYASKKPDFKTTDKDCHAICHLSDFDIYTPTEAQMRRHLKPPKKFCYAIKSQQKTTVFLSMDSYVHYFCTEDPNMAQRFHALVHGWRSWYLVNRRVELAIKKKTTAPKIPAVKHKPKKSLNVVNVNGHRLKVSVDEAPYTPGSFEPLMDMKRFEKPIDEFGKDFLPAPQKAPQKAPPQEPAPATPKKARNPPKPLIQPDDSAFNASGLLGDSYTARKAAEADKKREAQLQDGPGDKAAFTGGDTLLNMANSPEKSHEENRPEPRSWFPSATEHSAKTKVDSRPSTSGGSSGHQRPPPPPPDFQSRFGPSTGLRPSASVRGDGRRPGPGRPRPLVDLTPKFQEAPQWRNQGGHGVRAPAGMHLVDLISTGQPQSGDKFLGVPSARSMVRRDVSSSSVGSASGGGSSSSNSHQPQPQPQEREARGMHRLAPSAGRQRSRTVAGGGGGGYQGPERSSSNAGARRPTNAGGEPPVPPLPLRAREIEVRRPSIRDAAPGPSSSSTATTTTSSYSSGGDRRARDDRLRGRSGTVRY